jgi:carbonic anhydrase/acetyltransferase-like protein (isoleucine patch superfamily)
MNELKARRPQAGGLFLLSPSPLLLKSILAACASPLETQSEMGQNAAMDSINKQLDTFLRKKPTLGKSVYIARGAVVLGDVTLGEYSSVWFNAVLRGDINRITVGHHTNIQDTAVLHLADNLPCILGNYVTVGHAAIVHACTIGDQVLVGMQSAILDGAVIGEESLIGAGALVTPGTRIPPGSLVLGAPCKVARALKPQERAGLKILAEKYVRLAAYYLKHRINVSRRQAP